ncbi:MAG: pseudouridine synthase [Candidatus Eisenbacteria bacterium]
MRKTEVHRLNRFLASRGIASRRKCDELIKDGRVRVNGKTVLLPGSKVIPGTDVVELDDCPVGESPLPAYILLNKPAGVIVSARDSRKRPTVLGLVPGSFGRLFPVGRLDLDTEGLLLLTNDGDLAFRLTHPSFQVEKRYEVVVKEAPRPAQIATLRRGVEFAPGVKSGRARVEHAGPAKERHLVRLAIREGRKRQVRLMCRAVGLTVLSLARTGLGPLELGSLAKGAWRPLTPGEIKRLKAAVAGAPAGRGRARSGGIGGPTGGGRTRTAGGRAGEADRKM